MIAFQKKHILQNNRIPENNRIPDNNRIPGNNRIPEIIVFRLFSQFFFLAKNAWNMMRRTNGENGQNT